MPLFISKVKVKEQKKETFICHLKLVANADETKLARLLFGVLCAVGVFKQLLNKFVFGFTH